MHIYTCMCSMPDMNAMNSPDPQAFAKPTYCDTPAKFAANFLLGYFKVRR